jgi:hypothetical protein
MKRSLPYKSLIALYNSVVVFALLTVWALHTTLQLSTFLVMLFIVPIGMYYVLSLTESLFTFSTLITSKKIKLLHQLLSAYCLLVTSFFLLAMMISISSSIEFIFTVAMFPLAAFVIHHYWLKFYKRVRKHLWVFKMLKRPSRQRSVEGEIVEELPVEKTTLTELVEDITPDDDSPVTVQYAAEISETEAPPLKGVADIDRRKFLKLIGGTSLGFAVLSLVMPQKASAAFFGSVPGPGTVALKDSQGNQIDPSEKGPTDGYSISEIDDDALPSYYGFVDKDGRWYISKEDSAGSYRYTKGNSSFSTNWGNRAALTYDYFDVIFA